MSQSRTNALIPPSLFVAAKAVITIRCLAMDYPVTVFFIVLLVVFLYFVVDQVE
jgi:hypothetical protein